MTERLMRVSSTPSTIESNGSVFVSITRAPKNVSASVYCAYKRHTRLKGSRACAVLLSLRASTANRLVDASRNGIASRYSTTCARICRIRHPGVGREATYREQRESDATERSR
jgi:hypothetical protein